jgi:hypothetical protein
MYATLLTISTNKTYTSGVDYLLYLDTILSEKYQDVYVQLKSAVEQNDILNFVLELVTHNEDLTTVEEHFFSSSEENCNNFQNALQTMIQLFSDHGFTVKVTIKENINFENYEYERLKESPIDAMSNIPLLDTNIFGYMWDTPFPKT